MSLVFITGGARSGKSRFALTYAQQEATRTGARVAFIATAQASDAEMTERIRRHREDRPSTWTTIEEPLHVAPAIERAAADGHRVIIVDCVTLLITNWLFEPPTEPVPSDAREEEIDRRVREIARVADESPALVLLVSNEVGLGIVPDNALARRFRDIAGRSNQTLAEAAREVYFCVSGIPMPVKGGRSGHG